jgi:glycosyltransferase involved in cell wall biosynthesis
MGLSEFRLMQIMLSSQDGGAETFFEKLCLALADAGIPQHVVIEPNCRREELLSAHPLVDVKTIRFRGLREIPGRIRIRNYLQHVKPSLILTWMDRAVKRAPKGFCPVVARLGGYYGLDRYRGCDRLIGNTPDLVEYFLKNGIPGKRVECIPNFGEIRDEVVSREEARARIRTTLGVPEHHRLLLALGRLHPSKAHDTLIRAIVPTADVTVIIAGDGPLRPALEALARELGVADRVRLLGWRTDTAELFAASDISVFPSRKEPFGNVVVESWGQRVPVIAARSVGPAWLIEDGIDGLLFDIDNVEQLTRHIQTLLVHPELVDRLVEAGYYKLQQHFSKESIVKRYITMFENVITCYHKVNC